MYMVLTDIERCAIFQHDFLVQQTLIRQYIEMLSIYSVPVIDKRHLCPWSADSRFHQEYDHFYLNRNL
uniref:Uncharacterized protein n=1 Tax=Candidatus Kentrum sp. FW TaxID=2126338 RepID=A0A450TF47_9GAMM|nr:MAG: hypothetical protein BECKFW1821A_GA0114235_12151 [Candidatus Kentron sp. FW]